MRLVAPQALALRRAALAASCLGATLAAHVASDPAAAAIGPPVAVVAATMILASILVGPRRTTFRARGPVRLLAWLIAGQAAAHLAMTSAPWAFGLPVHHGTPVITIASAATHVVAALVLAGLLARGERILVRALRVAAAVRRLARRRSRGGRAPAVVAVASRRPPTIAAPRLALPRGPPSAVVGH